MLELLDELDEFEEVERLVSDPELTLVLDADLSTISELRGLEHTLATVTGLTTGAHI